MELIDTHPTWNDIERVVRLMCSRSIPQTMDPKYVVGLSRGGLVPGVMVSHYLNIPFVAVNYSSKEGKGEYKGHDNILPEIGGAGLGYCPNLLIVDDICDSGHTMREVSDHYSQKHNYVYTMAIHYKESSIFKPDVYYYNVPANGPWLTYPWEP